VEDDVDIAEILVLLLRDETACRMIHVSDGFAALKQVQTLTPDLILLDYHLPGMNGMECLERLRATKGGEQTPIILMSASLPKPARERTDVLFVEKPFDLEPLLRLVLHVLDFRRERLSDEFKHTIDRNGQDQEAGLPAAAGSAGLQAADSDGSAHPDLIVIAGSIEMCDHSTGTALVPTTSPG
jgi:CheY-like chemotaxis protein